MARLSQVAIVGAGPAGAALAYLLARRNIDVTLLERQTDFAREFRGEALQPSGVDAFAQMGLGPQLAALPQTRLSAVEFYRGATRLGRFEFASGFGDFGPHVVSQPAMLEMLVGEASHYSNFKLRRGVTVRDLVLDTGRVTGVVADSTSGPIEIRADLVIGADGRASVIRKRAGLHEERSPQAFDVVWGKVPLPDFMSDRTTARAYVGGSSGNSHLMLCFPSYDDRLQFAWMIEKGSFGELRQRGIEQWIEEMAAHVSSDLAAHLRANRDDVTHPFLLDVVCDRLTKWSAPGLLLLGDASHPMSPVGGQGINIALRDALVAANHLCSPLASGASAAELDAATARIEAERTPEVRAVQRMQQFGPRLLFSNTFRRIILSPPVLWLLRRAPISKMVGRTVRPFAHGVTLVRLAE
ncbi:MAG TPA: FAD-dependent oxidoreductase [Candidatus Binatus sp.]|uniref:FAD-dependent oxidoreductase n=1 Tax=Candidatus Binatus sp. TaxID=2811406 RepID=UPI002B4A1AAA|nr:FAD-dependent oxidoreductase [Candidatus Binatus sp.]HKN11836.1 FAD-dependent oxidoreductase [Candidatus Binatus sp.]